MSIKSNVFFKFFLVFFLLVFFVFFLAKSYADTVFDNISENFLRLHIVANSDSTQDQTIKYEIRDSLLNYLSPYLENVNSKEEAISVINNNMPKLYDLSYEILSSHNLSYPVKISVGNFNFPTKDYSKFVLPEGNYDALKVELGNACGQNWWCIMFPSLCIVDYSQFNMDFSHILDDNTSLNSEGVSIISKSNDSADIKIKFKLIELFENI